MMQNATSRTAAVAYAREAATPGQSMRATAVDGARCSNGKPRILSSMGFARSCKTSTHSRPFSRRAETGPPEGRDPPCASDGRMHVRGGAACICFAANFSSAHLLNRHAAVPCRRQGGQWRADGRAYCRTRAGASRYAKWRYAIGNEHRSYRDAPPGQIGGQGAERRARRRDRAGAASSRMPAGSFSSGGMSAPAGRRRCAHGPRCGTGHAIRECRAAPGIDGRLESTESLIAGACRAASQSRRGRLAELLAIITGIASEIDDPEILHQRRHVLTGFGAEK